MNGFIRSFLPLIKKAKKYLLEIILLSFAFVITIVALALYIENDISTEEEVVLDSPASQQNIYIDVSGAVKKPDLYQVRFGARIKEVIDMAKGLSEDADVMYFNRNFNLARTVMDQEKIYIPSVSEINTGIFIQNQRTLDYFSSIINNPNISTAPDVLTKDQLINLNFATIEELDQLPGIGQVTANKIIINRPYTTLDELLMKKVVNKGVFEKIKNLISI